MMKTAAAFLAAVFLSAAPLIAQGVTGAGGSQPIIIAAVSETGTLTVGGDEVTLAMNGHGSCGVKFTWSGGTGAAVIPIYSEDGVFYTTAALMNNVGEVTTSITFTAGGSTQSFGIVVPGGATHCGVRANSVIGGTVQVILSGTPSNSHLVGGEVTSNQGAPGTTSGGWFVRPDNFARAGTGFTSASAIDSSADFLNDTSNLSTVLVTLTSTSTITAGAINFEVSDQATTPYFPIRVTRINQATSETSYTLAANDSKAWLVTITGSRRFRVRLNPVITGTGTVTIGMSANAFPAGERVYAARPGDETGFSCAMTSTAMASTVVTGCSGSVTTLAAPGANLRFYITGFDWSSSSISTTTNFMLLQSGTTGTCGASTIVLNRGFVGVAFTGRDPDVGPIPMRGVVNGEVCFVHPGAGTRFINVRGYVAP